jgi:starch synthase
MRERGTARRRADNGVAASTPGSTIPPMPMRVALLASECEPWAKTGGLADVVDALARALGRLPEAGGALAAPVDVFLPRYRSVPVPADTVAEPALRIADPRGGPPIDARILDVAADGYRLRLVDVPAAFDRDGFYDFPDDPWRFAVLARAALAALRRDGTPLDVLHAHDWHTGPALLERARGEAAGDPFFTRMAAVLTLHNLAYHGWTGNDRLAQLGLRRGDALAGDNPDGIDLLLAGIERAEIVNTVSPGFAREARTPAFGMGLDGPLRDLGDRFPASSTASTRRSGTPRTTRRSPPPTRGPSPPARPPAGPTSWSGSASIPPTTAWSSG